MSVFYISKCCCAAYSWNECGKLYFLLHTICVYCLWWLILCVSFVVVLDEIKLYRHIAFWNVDESHPLVEGLNRGKDWPPWARENSLQLTDFTCNTGSAEFHSPSGPWYRCGLTIFTWASFLQLIFYTYTHPHCSLWRTLTNTPSKDSKQSEQT